MIWAYIIFALAVAGAFCFCGWFVWHRERVFGAERAEWSHERAVLLNRLMARDWSGYVQGERALMVTPPATGYMDDAAEAAWAAKQGASDRG